MNQVSYFQWINQIKRRETLISIYQYCTGLGCTCRKLVPVLYGFRTGSKMQNHTSLTYPKKMLIVNLEAQQKVITFNILKWVYWPTILQTTTLYIPEVVWNFSVAAIVILTLFTALPQSKKKLTNLNVMQLLH